MSAGVTPAHYSLACGAKPEKSSRSPALIPFFAQKPPFTSRTYSDPPSTPRKLFDDLAQVWSGRASRKPRWIANAIDEMINHVRNNVFHGLKAPDDTPDRELVDRINPILMGVLATSTHYERSAQRL
jgi:hypothetical protein